MCFSDELIKTVAVIKKLNLGLCNSKTDKGEGKLAKQNRDYCKCKNQFFLTGDASFKWGRHECFCEKGQRQWRRGSQV